MDFHRKTYYEDDDFHVYLELIGEQLFVHVVIYKTSKEVIKRIKEKWEEVVVEAWFEGFEDLFTYTNDNRIINIIGNAEKLGDHHINGKDYEVFKWELRQ